MRGKTAAKGLFYSQDTGFFKKRLHFPVKACILYVQYDIEDDKGVGRPALLCLLSGKAGKCMENGRTVDVCRALAEPVAAELGLSLWDVRFEKEGAGWYLRYVIDKEGGVGIDDCAALSRRLSPLLDEADPIAQTYCLEVMSPGIERELIRPAHFEAYLDWPVVVSLIRPQDGEREFAGYLRRYGDGEIVIEEEDGTLRTFRKKEVAHVHVLDDADGLEESDDSAQ